MQTMTPGKKRYYLTFIDDYSRYTVVYLLNSKDEVFDKLKCYIEMLKNKFSTYPSVIRSDNGGEYTAKHVQKFIDSKGIQYQYTVPYCPQRNVKN